MWIRVFGKGSLVTIVCWFLFSFERFARFHHFRGSSKDVRGFLTILWVFDEFCRLFRVVRGCSWIYSLRNSCFFWRLHGYGVMGLFRNERFRVLE